MTAEIRDLVGQGLIGHLDAGDGCLELLYDGAIGGSDVRRIGDCFGFQPAEAVVEGGQTSVHLLGQDLGSGFPPACQHAQEHPDDYDEADDAQSSHPPVEDVLH